MTTSYHGSGPWPNSSTRDVPDKFDIHYFEVTREHGPFGAAGVGAIKHATGAPITHPQTGPARPERVLDGLQKPAGKEEAVTA